MSTPTVRIIHDKPAEPLHISLFKLGVLVFGLGVIAVVLLTTGISATADVSHAYSVQMQTMQDVPVEAGILSDILSLLRSAWDLFWIVVRILMWLAIAFVGVMAVLAVLAGVGILTWVGKQAAGVIAWLVGLVKAAWAGSEVKPSGKWTVDEILKDLDSRLEVVERLTAIAKTEGTNE